MGFPHQQIDHFTAEVWWDTLKDYTREEVGRALARCLGSVEFISCYALVEAIKDDRRGRLIGQSTRTALPACGVGMPPETKEAVGVLQRSMLSPDHPDYLPGDVARKRIDQLADYLDARLAERSTAPRRNGDRP